MGNGNSQLKPPKNAIARSERVGALSGGMLMVIDVVCGMEIDERTTKWKSEFKGKTYYFCGPMCKLEFDENPEKYVQQDSSQLGK